MLPQETPKLQEAKAGLIGLHPRVRAAALWALNQAVALGIPVKITSSYRTESTQDSLRKAWEAGRNPYPANKPGESSHNWGMSFDSTVPVKDQERWNAIRASAGFSIYPETDKVHAEYPDWKKAIKGAPVTGMAQLQAETDTIPVAPTARDREEVKVVHVPSPADEPPPLGVAERGEIVPKLPKYAKRQMVAQLNLAGQLEPEIPQDPVPVPPEADIPADARTAEQLVQQPRLAELTGTPVELQEQDTVALPRPPEIPREYTPEIQLASIKVGLPEPSTPMGPEDVSKQLTQEAQAAALASIGVGVPLQEVAPQEDKGPGSAPPRQLTPLDEVQENILAGQARRAEEMGYTAYAGTPELPPANDIPLRAAEDAYGHDITTTPVPQERPDLVAAINTATRGSSLQQYSASDLKRVSAEMGVNPIDLMTSLGDPRTMVSPSEIPFGAAVSRGAYSGLRRYAQIFGADPDPGALPPNLTESGVGRFLGEALAATPMFLTGSVVAGTVMKGLGLSARMTPLAYSITRSATTGATLGILKTPSKDFSMLELAKNMTEEAALWTAFDAGILAVTGKMATMARTGREIRGIRTQVRGGKEFVDPVLLKFEEAMFVNASRNWREVANRVHELWKYDPENAFAGLVARVQTEANAFGQTVLHGLDEKSALRAAKEIRKVLGKDYLVGPHLEGERSGIVIFDGTAMNARSTAQRTSEALFRYQQKGEISEDLLVDLLLRGVSDRGGLPPLEVFIKNPATGVVSARYEFSLGKGSKIIERRIRITMPKDANPRELIETLAHELTHDMILTTLGEVPATGLLRTLFHSPSEAMARGVQTRQTLVGLRKLLREELAMGDEANVGLVLKYKGQIAAAEGAHLTRGFNQKRWLRELRAAQRALHTDRLGSRKAGLDHIRKNRLASDEFELLADFVQLLSRNRGAALHNAPTVAETISGWARSESLVIRSILDKETIATEALLREYATHFGESAEAVMEASTKIAGKRTSLRRIRAEQRIEAERALAQFEREGVFDGMNAFLEGNMMEVERRFVKEGVIRLRSIERTTRGYKTIEVNEARVQLPTVQGNVKFGQTIKNVVTNVLKQGAPRTLGVFLKDGRGGVARAYFESRSMLHFKGNNFDLIEKITREKGAAYLKGLEEADVFIKYAKEQGKHGVFMDDEISMRIFADPTEAAIHYHDVSPDLISRVHGSVADREFILSAEDVLAEGLYQAGIPAREVERLAKYAMDAKAVELKKLIDYDFAPADLEGLWGDVLKGVEYFDQGGARSMRHGGGRMQIFPDGSHRIFVNTGEIPGGKLAAIMDDATASKRYIAKMAPPPGAANLSEGIIFPEQFATRMNPKGGAEPLKFGETAESRMGAKALDIANDADRTKFEMFESGLEKTGQAAKRAVTLLSSSRTYFQELERRGMGPLFTDLWQRSQKAMFKIKTRMGAPNDAMKIRTKGRHKGEHYSMISGTKDYQRRIQQDVTDLRRPLLTQLAMSPRRSIGESLPLEEGTLIVQKFIDSYAARGVDMRSKIPTLAGNMRAAERYLRDPAGFIQMLESELRGLPTKHREMARKLIEFKNNPEKITIRDILDGMGHTVEEAELMQVVAAEMKVRKDVDLFGLARHYSATMNRTEFIAKHNMTPKEVALSDELVEYVKEGMRIPGDLTEEQVKQHAETFLVGILPEVKNFVEQGFDINHSTITKFFGQHKEFLHRRMISGDLNVYVNDPAYLAWRVMRGKLMQAEWEPVRNGPIRKALQNLEDLRGTSSAPYRNATKYLQELEGIPHESFAQIEEALLGIFETMKLTNFVEPTILRDLIQKLNMTTYKATIPFRPLLLFRNASEIYRVGGITGGRSLGHGIDYVMNPKTRKAAFDEAWKAGALKPDQPVFTVDPSARTAIRAGIVNVKGPLAKARKVVRTGQRGVQILDDFAEQGMGFYQRVDEYTRAIAYHSMKHRIRSNIHLATPGTMQKFIQRSKLSTFDQSEIKHFEGLWNTVGSDAAIDYASVTFADKALFLYGNANHPIGWGSSYGVLFGQFGTWPVQYKDFMINGLTRGTAKDKLEFAAWNLAAPYVAVKAGRDIGIDLNSWWGVSSLRYGGGPYADASIDVIRAYTGNDAERAMARSNLKRLSTTPVPSIFVMNSFAVNDVYQMLIGEKPPIELMVKTYDAPKDSDQ